ncbi:MAG: hypothetical protein ACKVQK_02730 [Burkholderiales bacterium]
MMKKSLIAASFVTLTLTGLVAALPLHAQTEPPKGAPKASRTQIESLLTQDERNQFREKMRAAATREERMEIQKQMRGMVEQRAKEKGITLSRGQHGNRGARPGGDANRPQLLTPEERQQYRDKARAAKTPEERTALRQQRRELTAQRAKEKGVTLPPRRAPGEPQKGPAAKSA